MVSYTGPGEELESTLLTLGKGKVTKSNGQTDLSRWTTHLHFKGDQSLAGSPSAFECLFCS